MRKNGHFSAQAVIKPLTLKNIGSVRVKELTAPRILRFKLPSCTGSRQPGGVIAERAARHGCRNLAGQRSTRMEIVEPAVSAAPSGSVFQTQRRLLKRSGGAAFRGGCRYRARATESALAKSSLLSHPPHSGFPEAVFPEPGGLDIELAFSF